MFRPRTNILLALLLALLIGRLWLSNLRSSFWVDEMATVFVVHHGASDPTFAIAPQVPKSIYYQVARVADAAFGVSEAGYRWPSILLSGITLLLVARLAIRLIHPAAGWVAVFACLALKGFNWEAVDARPYALGFCVVAAAMLMLVRWSDSGGWMDALGFLICASLLLRVHLIFWPMYVVFLLYAAVRLATHETPVTVGRAAALFGIAAILLAPAFRDAFSIFKDARPHVIVPPPALRELLAATKWKLMLICTAGALAMAAAVDWRSVRLRPRQWISPSATALMMGWWLIPSLCLFGFSLATGNSVFVPRYLSIGLPGAALAATCLASRFLPKPLWHNAAALLATGVLFTLGLKPAPAPGSNWRDAARAVNELPAVMPVVAPSPFIEAKWPVWRPDYPVSSFLYSHLTVYPLRHRILVFPFASSPEAEEYAAVLCRDDFTRAQEFAIYGGDYNVHRWRDWFAKRPELLGWNHHSLGKFGDVDVVVFEKDMRTTSALY